MGKIILEDVEIFAHHGCLEQEKINGNWFIINLELETDMSIPAETDMIDDALNYTTVYEIVKQEMQIRSNLLEHVTNRILKKLFNTFQQLNSAVVKVSKLNPPIGGNMKCVAVELSWHRD